MVWAIILIVLFILSILLLQPVRVKAFFDDGKWAVDVKYTFFRLFHKKSEEEKPPDVPPKPLDQPDGAMPPAHLIPEPDAAESAGQTADPQPEIPSAAPAASHAETTGKPAVSDEISEENNNSDPKPEKAKKKKQKDTEVQNTPQPAQKSEKKPEKRGFIERLKPQSVSEAVGLAGDICASLSPALSSLTKHIHLRHVKIYAAIGSEDAAETATLYGKICIAAYNLLGQLQCWLDIDTEEFRILADFYNDSITFRGSLELRVSPAAAILIALILGSKFLGRTILRFHREDKEEKRRLRESAPIRQQ